MWRERGVGPKNPGKAEKDASEIARTKKRKLMRKNDKKLK
jgi:hypothetical protein